MTTVSARLRHLASILGLVATTIGVAGCSIGENSTLPPFSDPALQTYDASTGVVISNMTRVTAQLFTQDLVAGTGRTVAVGDSITVFYSGRLSTGFQFDARVAPAAPFSTVLADTRLIAGWVDGLPGMKVGGTRRLVIGPALAYEFQSRSSIPPNSVLVFDVQVTAATPR